MGLPILSFRSPVARIGTTRAGKKGLRNLVSGMGCSWGTRSLVASLLGMTYGVHCHSEAPNVISFDSDRV